MVIPALNEAKNLPLVLPLIPADVHEVILVDGLSMDETVEVARALLPSIRIVSEPRRGKGVALCAGFRAARGNIIVMLDADGSTDPAEIPRFVEALVAGADFAKGSRFLGDGGSSDISRLRALGNWGFVRLVRLMFGGRYTDLCYGYNAFWTSVLPDLALDGTGFEIETMMNVRALRVGLTITEVASFESSRVHGASNLRAFRDGWRILLTIFRERLVRSQTDGSWTEPRTASEHFASDELGRPHLVPVMDTASALQLEIAFDAPTDSASSRPRLVPVMDAPQTSVLPAHSLLPVYVDLAANRVAAIDVLRAGLQSVDEPGSDESEGEDSLMYAVGGEI